MQDLISRQAAIDAIERIFDRCEEIEAHLPKGDPDRVGYKMYPDWLTVWKYLHQLPSAQPDLSEYSDKLWRNAYERGKRDAQPEIIRCKDCMHDNHCAIQDAARTGNTFFCGAAERKEE